MVMSKSYDEAQTWDIPPSFTQFHGRLLDLCMNPPTIQNVPGLEKEGTVLTPKDIDSLITMVKQEFVASFLKELKSPEVPDAEPHVFDVYLMKVAANLSTLRRPKLLFVCPGEGLLFGGMDARNWTEAHCGQWTPICMSERLQACQARLESCKRYGIPKPQHHH